MLEVVMMSTFLSCNSTFIIIIVMLKSGNSDIEKCF